MMLADLGADVIKVESPSHPDPMRSSGGRSPDGATSLAFESINRGKRSLSLDLGRPGALNAVDALLGDADVVLQNYRPGVADRLGIGYQRVSEVNPLIVHVSISGFGASGPLRDLGGYDLIAQAMSGLMSVTGDPGGDPQKVGVPITDVACALYATVAVLAALRARDRCGHGQAIDCSLLDAGLSFGIWESAEYWSSGQAPAPSGAAHRALAPYQAFRTSDGWIVVAANSDDHFHRTCGVLDLIDLTTDNRFITNAVRLRNRKALAALLERATSTAPTEKWVARLHAAGVPCGPLLNFREAVEHPQAVERGMVASVERSDGRSHLVLGSPVHLSHTPVRAPGPAPALGQDDHAFVLSIQDRS